MIKFKYLAILPLLMICAVGAYFLSKNTPKPSVPSAKPEIHSQISDIKAVQTNPDTGEVEYTLTAKSLTQSAGGQDELLEVAMDWTPDKQSHYTIVAGRAIFDQKSGEFDFGGGFVLTQQTQNGTMTLTGDNLLGNTKTKQIHSPTPLTITQGDNQFFAKSMQGDLIQKTYEFLGINISFLPPKRQEQALF